jgi:hypothetical protein
MGVRVGFAGYAGVRGVEYAASKAAGNESYGSTVAVAVCMQCV